MIKFLLALDVCCNKLLFVYDLLLEETTHQQFTGITKRSQSAFPELQKTVTPHALKLVQGEVNKSKKLSMMCSIMTLPFYVRSKINQNSCYEISQDECTCRTFRKLLRPCRDIVACTGQRTSRAKPLHTTLAHLIYIVIGDAHQVPA